MTQRIVVGVLSAAVILAVAIGLTPSARALSVQRGTSSSDTIYVGMVNHDGSTKAWACIDSAGGTDSWVSIGTASGLNDDWAIYGDNTSGTGVADTMTVIRGSTTIGGYCAPNTGTWGALAYNGHYLDMYGDNGADLMKGGTGDGFVRGNADNDDVYHYSSLGDARGEGGTDDVFGASGVGEDLYGGDGDDCLDDFNDLNSVENCEASANDWYYTSNMGVSNCETAVFSTCSRN